MPERFGELGPVWGSRSGKVKPEPGQGRPGVPVPPEQAWSDEQIAAFKLKVRRQAQALPRPKYKWRR